MNNNCLLYVYVFGSSSSCRGVCEGYISGTDVVIVGHDHRGIRLIEGHFSDRVSNTTGGCIGESGSTLVVRFGVPPVRDLVWLWWIVWVVKKRQEEISEFVKGTGYGSSRIYSIFRDIDGYLSSDNGRHKGRWTQFYSFRVFASPNVEVWSLSVEITS
jgi:hypothetical protein